MICADADQGIALQLEIAALHSDVLRSAPSRSLRQGAIWRDSRAFNAYRSDDSMQEPCRSCDKKGLDLDGCRCQAFMLAGDAAASDSVYAKSPRRHEGERVFVGNAGDA